MCQQMLSIYFDWNSKYFSQSECVNKNQRDARNDVTVRCVFVCTMDYWNLSTLLWKRNEKLSFQANRTSRSLEVLIECLKICTPMSYLIPLWAGGCVQYDIMKGTRGRESADCLSPPTLLSWTKRSSLVNIFSNTIVQDCQLIQLERCSFVNQNSADGFNPSPP